MATCHVCYQAESQPSTIHSSSELQCRSKASEARCTACKDLAKLDEEITEYRRRLLALLAQRPRLLAEVNNAHDSISRRLPVEILSDIFQRSLPDSWHSLDDYPVGASAAVPLLLSQVCRRWRAVAQTTPSLWNVMPLHVGPAQASTFPAICELAQDWLKRSGAHLPLHMVINITPDANLRGEDCDRLFTIIKVYEGRLDSLRVEAPDLTLLRLRQLRANLTTLHLSVASPEVPHITDIDNESNFRLSFRPKTLTMSGHTVFLRNVDFCNLTHFTANYVDVGDVLILLGSSPSLLSCKIGEISFENGGQISRLPPIPNPPPQLPALQELLMEPQWTYVDVLCYVLDAFNFPALETFAFIDLETDMGRCDPEPLLEAVIRNISRSKSHLKSMTFFQMPEDSELLRNISVAAPGLQHLSMRTHINGSDADLAALIAANLPFFPQLRSLKLYAYGGSDLIQVLKILLFPIDTNSSMHRGLSIVIAPLSGDPFLDETGNFDIQEILDLDYCINGAKTPFATDIQQIMNIMGHDWISVSILDCDENEVASEDFIKALKHFRHCVLQNR